MPRYPHRLGHRRQVGGNKNEVRSESKVCLCEGVVHVVNSCCKFFEFVDNWSEKRLNVLGVLGTGNDAAE